MTDSILFDLLADVDLTALTADDVAALLADALDLTGVDAGMAAGTDLTVPEHLTLD